MKPGDLVVKRKNYRRWGNVLDGVGLILREAQDPAWSFFAATAGESPPVVFEVLFNGQVVEADEYELETLNEAR
jgi:hypothetical protein